MTKTNKNEAAVPIIHRHGACWWELVGTFARSPAGHDREQCRQLLSGEAGSGSKGGTKCPGAGGAEQKGPSIVGPLIHTADYRPCRPAIRRALGR